MSRRDPWLLVVVLLVIVIASGAHAHPLSQGALDFVVHPDRVEVRARVTVEEVIITDLMTTPLAPDPVGPDAAKPSVSAMYARHAKYLAGHVHVTTDGVPLQGRVERMDLPASRPTGEAQPPPDREHAIYTVVYQPAAGAAAGLSRPKKVDISQDVLVGMEFSPGVTWEASYAVRTSVAGGPITEGL